MNEVTQILSDLARGDAHAAGQLLPLVYDELRKLAAARMAEEAPGNTLNATALVHEAYLRLGGPEHAPPARSDPWGGAPRKPPPAGTPGATFSPPGPKPCGEFWWTPPAGSGPRS